MQVVAVPQKENRGRVFEIGMSQRMMDSLGLQEGDRVSICSGKLTYILPVRRTPLCDDRVVSLPGSLLLSSEELRVEPRSPQETTIGCDPEFILVDQNNTVKDASRIFGKTAQLGSDACLGELRPSPSNKVTDVVGSLQQLILKIPEATELVPIAMSWYRKFVCGFHVHIGLPSELALFASDKAPEFVKNMMRLFDYYIGVPAMLRDSADKRRLCKGCYGHPGDYRMSTHTVEYRTPGGFHLRSPQLALELLTASFVVAEDVLGRAALTTRLWTKPDKFYSYKHFADAYELPADYSTIVQSMTSPERTPAKELLEKLRTSYDSLYGYKKASDVLKGFLSGEVAVGGPYMLENWTRGHN